MHLCLWRLVKGLLNHVQLKIVVESQQVLGHVPIYVGFSWMAAVWNLLNQPRESYYMKQLQHIGNNCDSKFYLLAMMTTAQIFNLLINLCENLSPWKPQATCVLCQQMQFNGPFLSFCEDF